jgi:hypothetical protein
MIRRPTLLNRSQKAWLLLRFQWRKIAEALFA